MQGYIKKTKIYAHNERCLLNFSYLCHHLDIRTVAIDDMTL